MVKKFHLLVDVMITLWMKYLMFLKIFLEVFLRIQVELVGEASDFLGDVQSVTKNIQRLTNNPVSAMMDSLYRDLIPLLRTGIEGLL